jgi:hypothetical protein
MRSAFCFLFLLACTLLRVCLRACLYLRHIDATVPLTARFMWRVAVVRVAAFAGRGLAPAFRARRLAAFLLPRAAVLSPLLPLVSVAHVVGQQKQNGPFALANGPFGKVVAGTGFEPVTFGL